MKYPECEKIAKVKDKSQLIGEFLDWARSEKNIELCEPTDLMNPHDHREILDELAPISQSIEQLLADFFDIDLDKAEKERQQIIDDLRK